MDVSIDIQQQMSFTGILVCSVLSTMLGACTIMLLMKFLSYKPYYDDALD